MCYISQPQSLQTSDNHIQPWQC